MAKDDAFFEALRAEEFARLDRNGLVYLDFGGSGLYGESQIHAHHEALLAGVYGNPHSEHAPSRASTRALDDAREAVLAHFGVSSATHVVCFTANASAAIKLVAEGFPFSPDRGLLLSTDNHNSVNGLREYAQRAGASVDYIALDEDLRLSDPVDCLHRHASAAGLFAFPAQSNFSGVKHPLALVGEARANGWRVLLDAASFAPTSRLDLSTCEADFVPVSFYKMFGYPTGLGALIARRESIEELRRPWFAGGTVEYVSVQHGRHQLRAGHAAFEDGTANFAAALAIPLGLEILNRIGQPRLVTRMRTLTEYFLAGLRSIRHANGRATIVPYGPASTCDRGGVIAFNVVESDGRPVPYWTIEEAARNTGIALRGGCFCNPGAAEAAFRMDAGATLRCLRDLGGDFTIPAFASCLGPSAVVGAVRVSMGVPTTIADLDRALEFLSDLLGASRREAGVALSS